MKKRWEPERTRYRIDRVQDGGQVDEWFYGEIFPSQEAAQKFIDDRGPSYRGQLRVEMFVTPAGYVYEETIRI